MPTDPAALRGLALELSAAPVAVAEGEQRRIADPWTRLGRVLIVGEKDQASIELMRFITAFGAPSTHTLDVTAFAPKLQGEVTLRFSIETWKDPGWTISAHLKFHDETVGARRPVLAVGVVEGRLSPESPKLLGTISIPRDLAQPRLRLLTTGHGSKGGDEFVTRTHVIRVDGREVLRIRPWDESGAQRRQANPGAGKKTVGGREIWASDFDRSGWSSSATIEPLIIPCPELTPGSHQVEVAIIDFPRADQDVNRFWVVNLSCVADGPWPTAANPPEEPKPD